MVASGGGRARLVAGVSSAGDEGGLDKAWQTWVQLAGSELLGIHDLVGQDAVMCHGRTGVHKSGCERHQVQRWGIKRAMDQAGRSENCGRSGPCKAVVVRVAAFVQLGKG